MSLPLAPDYSSKQIFLKFYLSFDHKIEISKDFLNSSKTEILIHFIKNFFMFSQNRNSDSHYHYFFNFLPTQISVTLQENLNLLYIHLNQKFWESVCLYLKHSPWKNSFINLSKETIAQSKNLKISICFYLWSSFTSLLFIIIYYYLLYSNGLCFLSYEKLFSYFCRFSSPERSWWLWLRFFIITLLLIFYLVHMTHEMTTF